MPDDNIVSIAIDIGLIREAQRRVELRRAMNDLNSSFRNHLSSAVDTVMDILRNLYPKEEEPDET